MLYGINATYATAAVLVYHAIALWVPTVLGTIAFVFLRRQLKDPEAVRAKLRPERA